MLYAGVVLVAWSSIEDVNDYAGLVAGARAILAGESPYDATTWPTAYQHLGTQRPDTAVYGYPAWIALLFIPLAPLPIWLGSLVFTGGTLALATVAARSLARSVGAPPIPATILATASWPAFFVFLQGQWAYLLLALSIATYLDLAQGRDRRAGVWWAAAVLIKPQLFVLGSAALAVYVLRARRWSVIAAAALVSVAVIGLSALLVPGWWTPWLGAVASRRLVRSTQQPTLAGLAGDVAGDAWPIAWGVAIAALAILILWSARRAPEHRGAIAFAGFLSLSLGSALYSWSYDQYLCIAAGIVALGVAPPAARRSVVIAALALFVPVALGLWISAFPRYHDTGSGLVPPLAIALVAFAATRPREH
jgi:alpha-1,2-mannosyltransferase